MVGIEIKNIKDHTTKNHYAKNTIKVTVKTRPKINITSIIKKDISL
jgi:hypothetical protein